MTIIVVIAAIIAAVSIWFIGAAWIDERHERKTRAGMKRPDLKPAEILPNSTAEWATIERLMSRPAAEVVPDDEIVRHTARVDKWASQYGPDGVWIGEPMGIIEDDPDREWEHNFNWDEADEMIEGLRAERDDALSDLADAVAENTALKLQLLTRPQADEIVTHLAFHGPATTDELCNRIIHAGPADLNMRLCRAWYDHGLISRSDEGVWSFRLSDGQMEPTEKGALTNAL